MPLTCDLLYAELRAVWSPLYQVVSRLDLLLQVKYLDLGNNNFAGPLPSSWRNFSMASLPADMHAANVVHSQHYTHLTGSQTSLSQPNCTLSSLAYLTRIRGDMS